MALKRIRQAQGLSIRALAERSEVQYVTLVQIEAVIYAPSPLHAPEGGLGINITLAQVIDNQPFTQL
ncbi:MAG: hypothetical protein NPIRA06_21520 [Nitrospirales bacterium]|nr:MAG: hypothetical protein NPIRA06_21520 [Nitrospirales bacterium]